MEKIISRYQFEFLKGRFIGENIRSLYNLMIPDLLIVTVFEKTLDSISWDFVLHTLYLFNFFQIQETLYLTNNFKYTIKVL